MIAPASEELRINVNGQLLAGWQEFEVYRGVEELPSGFVISLTEKYPKFDEIVPVPFQSCEVFLSDDKVLTGFVDIYEPSYNKSAHRVTIAGRSKTEDLVDCSVDVDALGAATGTWEIGPGTIGTAAKTICKPYSIDVVLPDDDPALPYPFIVQPGMTCFQLLEEMARSVQMLIWDDAQGRLVISRVGKKRAASALVEG
jgi:prophage tail gpP-like protein